MNRRQIFVLGSANMDLVFAVDRLPLAGETLTGGDLALFPGGKGANQACAAARLGGCTSMIARVGDDLFGSKLAASLRAAGADVSRVRCSARPTGSACILVMPNGENSIVISPGANATIDPAGALADLAEIRAGDMLLAQLEVPVETVQAAFEFAKERGATTVLDPAPARRLPARLLRAVDYITPNQTEAATLLAEPGRSIASYEDAAAAADRIVALGPAAAVMKLGEQGCLFSNGQTTLAVPGFLVDAVDTTAAGDVFNGAFAVALSEGAEVERALRFANAAAALSVTRRGAQTSVPSRPEADTMLREAVAASPTTILKEAKCS